MDLTKSAAEGWRMRSRKSCHVRGAVEDPKASEPPPPSIRFKKASALAFQSTKFFGSEEGDGGMEGNPIDHRPPPERLPKKQGKDGI